MKSLLTLAVVSTIFSNFAIAQKTPVQFGGMVENRKTKEQLVVKCIDLDCKTKDVFLLKPSGDGRVDIEKINKRPLIVEAKMDRNVTVDDLDKIYLTKQKRDVEVLPEISTASFDTIGWFFNLTGEMWEGISYAEGEPYYIPAIIGGSIASVIVAPLDLVGTVVIDTALIASYPIRKFINRERHQWNKGNNLIQILQSNKTRIKNVSNKNFKRLIKDLRQNI